VLAVLLFTMVGLGLLSVVALDALRRRKYGLARFVPAAVPVPLHSEVAGMVLVNRRIVPSAAGRVALDCVRTTLVRSGNKRTQRDEVVAHTEREIRPADWTSASDESRLFVQLPMTGGVATTMGKLETDHPTYEWRLRVSVPTTGADFVAEFVLPVFEVARPPSAASSDSEIHPTNRAEVFRAAGIREEPQPGAARQTALHFPKGQGRAVATAPLVMTIVFGATALVLWMTPVPGIITGFVAVFAILPALALQALLTGGGERLWIESGVIVSQRDRRAERRVAISEVPAIEPRKSVGVGSVTFHRIAAICPAPDGKMPRRVELASMVRGEQAAREVVAWVRERMR
jgi:hypothetical protein